MPERLKIMRDMKHTNCQVGQNLYFNRSISTKQTLQYTINLPLLENTCKGDITNRPLLKEGNKSLLISSGCSVSQLHNRNTS